MPRPRKRTIVRINSYGLWFARAYFAGLGRFAPALADRQATRLFFTPSPRRAAEPGAISGREPERFTVTVGRRRMRCWRYGSGPVVVFVHGWSGSARDWTSVAARVIDEGFTAVLCDFPAHGGSDGRQTDLPEMSRALHALADELAFGRGGRVEPLHAVVAHSFGGAATALAARDGLLSGSIVLLAPVAYPMSFVAPFAAALGLSRERVDGIMAGITARVGGDLALIDVPRAIATVSTRGLIVHDRLDATVDWSQGRALAGAWPGAETVWTEGLGHRGLLRDAEVVARVAEFIAAGRNYSRDAHPWPGLAVSTG